MRSTTTAYLVMRVIHNRPVFDDRGRGRLILGTYLNSVWLTSGISRGAPATQRADGCMPC